ncbi:SatD family protein [Fusobacterium nucleatum]
MKKYSVLMVDLKNSRSYDIQDRNNIQNSILSSINILNKIFKNSIEKEVKFSAGDEIQGLFISPQSAYLYYRLFSMLIFPIQIHTGIGFGTWDIRVENESSTAQDGTVYHNARKAIDEAKKSLEYSVLFYSKSKNDIIVNSLINSNNLLTIKQSKYQNNLMLLAEILYPITNGDIIEYEKLKELLKFIQFEKKENLIIDIEYPIISTQLEKQSFYITEGKKRGLSTQISKLLGVSRQSVEKSIKIGDIYELRNLTIAVLKAMDNI